MNENTLSRLSQLTALTESLTAFSKTLKMLVPDVCFMYEFEENIFFNCLAFVNTYWTFDYLCNDEKETFSPATANNPQLSVFPIWLVKSTKQNSCKWLSTHVQSIKYLIMLDLHPSLKIHKVFTLSMLIQHEVMHWEPAKTFKPRCVFILQTRESSYLHCSVAQVFATQHRKAVLWLKCFLRKNQNHNKLYLMFTGALWRIY